MLPFGLVGASGAQGRRACHTGPSFYTDSFTKEVGKEGRNRVSGAGVETVMPTVGRQNVKRVLRWFSDVYSDELGIGP